MEAFVDSADEVARVDFYRFSKARVAGHAPEGTRSPLEPSDQPVRSFADPDYSFASLLSYLEGHGVAESEPKAHAAFLSDLVEFEGGGWALFEPTQELIAGLAPEGFRHKDLADWYEADGPPRLPQPGRRMLEGLETLRSVVAVTETDSFVIVHIY